MNVFTKRYELTLDRVRKGGPPAYSRDFVLADAEPRHVRRFTEFSGDVSGRWIGALASASTDRSETYPELESLLPALIRLQKAEGYFGETFAPKGVRKEDMAVLWGNGRLLIGLMEAHRHKPDPAVLASARKLGDFIVRIAPTLNSAATQRQFETGAFAMGYICWTQIAEGLVALHAVTKDPAHKRVAIEMAERTERKPNEHSHGFLSSVRGMVDLFETTGDRGFLQRAEREWRGVVDSGNVLAPGSIPEAWKPKAHRTEGCSEADWLRLGLQLWRLTGKREYLDAAERTLFNEFAMNQFATGDFGHRVLSDTGVPMGGNEEGGGTARAWWCCTLHGLRAFPAVSAHVFGKRGDVLTYDLPVEGRGKIDGLEMTAASTLESIGEVRLRVDNSDSRPVPLALREPPWAYGIDVFINGLRIATLNRDGYHRLSHPWKRGDEVRVRYRMRTRAERDAEGRVAVFHGPWLLAVDESANPSFFDEPHKANRLRIAVPSDLTLDLERDPTPLQSPFAVPAARFRVAYLPGGYRITPSTAILRPVAEQTGMPTTPWEFWFRTERESQ